jgi:hypothetical protein
MKTPDLKLPSFSLSGVNLKDTKIILVLVGGLALHFLIAAGFLIQRGSARDGLVQETKTLESKWADEDQLRKEKQEAELQQKYGTNQLDRIAADPRMDIRLALQKLFKAVLESENTVVVTVDRFTEFRVYVTTGNLPEPSKLAGPLKDVFTRIDPKLVDEIVFSDGDRFWVIEAYRFHNLDWQNATTEQIVTACFPKT